MKNKIKTFLILVFGGGFLFFTLSNLWIINSTHDEIFKSVEDIPPTDVALVLGTSKRLKSGETNPYFNFRIDAAEKLFVAGKVKHLILSGDNRTKYYNEPQYMREALLEKGIPDSVITMDYAGLRTFDSVVRCKKIFGQSKFIIVTQQFHSYRAVFIAKHFDIEATAFVADNIALSKSLSVLSREFLARPKAILDIFLLDVSPKFMGKKEEINVI